MKTSTQTTSSRRDFLGTLATGAAALGAGAAALGATAWTTPLKADGAAGPLSTVPGEAEAWFNQINGKHRMVFDAPRPHDIYPFAWPRVFLVTNAATGTPENENSVVVVLRHDAIPYAMENDLWEKYKFGEMFKVPDPQTGKPAVHNPFWKPQPGSFEVPGLGHVAIGIDELQESGVLFCVCQMAITVYSAAIAARTGVDAAAIKKEWLAGLLPGIQPVPSGIWALGRAQEHGCLYCYTG